MPLLPRHRPFGWCWRRSLFASGSPGAGRGRRSGERLRRRRPFLELLEDRTLLSATISGSVYNDLAGDGVRQAADPGLAGQTVFLDLNGDGQLGTVVNTVTKSTPTPPLGLVDLTSTFGAPAFVSVLKVANLPTRVEDVAVNLSVTNNSSSAVSVVLLSPTGLSALLGTGDLIQGPYVLTLRPGQSFSNLTIDGNATPTVNEVALHGAVLADGHTYGPQQSFAAPQTFIDTVNPNGKWGLLFFTPDEDPAEVSLNSWSLSFTQPEPSTQTDAAGNYTFQGVKPGPYNVDLVVPAGETVTSPGGASRAVTVADGQTAAGVDFGLRPLPDLAGVSFTLAAPATQWGQKVTINYTLTNRWAGGAGAFDAGVYLSAGGVIGTGGPLLDTLHFSNLAAGASVSGSVTVTLPAQPPAGFDSLSTAYVGLVIDPAQALTETSTADNSNQGAGIDLALLGIPLNEAVSSGGVQQDPSVAADPAHPNHLVAAYMDYGLLHTGYAGIGIAVSDDGGRTWTTSPLPPQLPAGFEQGAALPSVAFDAQGNVYVSFMAATFRGAHPGLTDPATTAQRRLGLQSDNGIFIAKSSDGGVTWGTPVPITQHTYAGAGTAAPTADPNAVPFDEYPALAIDTTPGSPHFGNLYVTWSRFYPGAAADPASQYPGGDPSTNTGGSDVLVAVSPDGTNWTTQLNAAGVSVIRDPFDGPTGGTVVAGNGLVKFSSITLGPDGAVFVALDTGGYFAVYASLNGAHSFRVPLIGGLGGNYRGNPFDFTQTGVLPNGTLDNFTTFRTRAIAADPTHPGVLYAIAPSGLAAAQSQPGTLAAANGIVFAVSTDYGGSWASTFTVGDNPPPVAQLTPDQVNSGYEPVLNDDNGGQYPGFAASAQTQVVASQAFPSISVSPQGVIAVTWYDTRSDPAGEQLQVWGTVSTDGGRHFSANFPVTNTSFDPSAGAFTDATGHHNFSLGTRIALVAAGDGAYAVWTDTRNGGQQIFGGGFSLGTVPAAPVDRFAPDFTRATAADLGAVTATQTLPRLRLLSGPADEWFRFQAGASGSLDVSVAADAPGSDLHLEITDALGNVITPTTVTDVLDATGAVVGLEIVAPSVSGKTYFAHVFGTSAAGIGYTLSAGTLTLDFQTRVEAGVTDTVGQGGQNLYRLAAGITGTLQVSLAAGSTVQGGLNLTILGADGHTVLASDLNFGVAANQAEQLAVAVGAGQVVFLQVSGANLTSDSGDFSLRFTNFDQFETPSAAVQGQGATTDNISAPVNSYQLVAGLTGTLNVTLTGVGTVRGNMNLTIVGADGHKVLASDGGAGVGDGSNGGVAQNQETVSLPVTAGQVVFLRVSSANLNAAADYTLQFQNLPATTNQTLFFPTGSTPSALAAADLTGSGRLDLIASNTTVANTVSVLAGNGDGTFRAAHQFNVGVGLSANLIPGSRPVAVADLNGDSLPDLVVPNFTSADVSVLLGNGDASFQPQRRFDAVANPTGMVTGDFNNDGHADVIVRQSFTQSAQTRLAVLLGRGDGTFLPPVYLPTAFAGAGADGPMVVGDFGNGNLDVVIFSNNQATGQIFYGNGDGSFGGTLDPVTGKYAGPGKLFTTGESAIAAAAADLNGDGRLDLVTTGANTGNVYVMLGNGDGTFRTAVAYQALAPRPGDNVTINGLVVTDFGGSPGGPPNLVVTAAPRSDPGAAEVILLPGKGDGTFGAPVVLAHVGTAGAVVAGNFCGGGTDLAVADTGGVTVIYGQPLTLTPNTTLNTARDLGSVTHAVQLPVAVVTGFEDAYYTFTVPTEVVPGAGAEVLDFSALFQYTEGPGLQFTVTDAAGNVLGAGQRFRVVVPQGEVLTLHVAGAPGAGGVRGAGAVTLDIDVLPQVVSVQAESALPGGPVTSLVITFQGDRLNPSVTDNPGNFTVTWLGPNGPQNVPLAKVGQPVVYDPSANVHVSSGLTYPTAVRRTITLLFDQPLPAGSYQVTLSPHVQAASSAGEAGILAGDNASYGSHPVVLAAGGTITNGSPFVVANLVTPPGTPNPNAIAGGTPFLTQLENDLGAYLDALLAKGVSDADATALINQEVVARFGPGAAANIPIAVFWLDPVSLDVQAPQQAGSVSYSQRKEAVKNDLGQTFVEVGGNVEVVVMAGLAGTFKLDVSDVPETARGGAIVLANGISQVVALTDALRESLTTFDITVPEAPLGGPGPGDIPIPPLPLPSPALEVVAAPASSESAAALVATLLYGVPAEAATTSTSPLGTLTSSVTPATLVDEQTGPGLTTNNLRAVIDDVLRRTVPALTGPVGENLLWLGRTGLQLLEQAASRLGGVLEALGVRDLQVQDLGRPWQGLFNNLMDAGAAAVEAAGAQIPMPLRPAGKPAPAPQRQGVADDGPVELQAPLGRLEGGPRSPLDAGDLHWAAALLLSGAALQAAWGDLVAAEGSNRKRSPQPPGLRPQPE